MSTQLAVLAAIVATAFCVEAATGFGGTVVALTLGASRFGAAWALLGELRRGALAAVATGFGRLVSELGVALMVGGNIEGATRTMTTAIALETGKGEFALALALGLILLAVALLVNIGAALVTGGR